MSELERDGLNLDDPDRLPWLETADGYEYNDGASPLKVALMVLGGLAFLAAIVGAIYWTQRNQSAGTDGNGALIAAQEGDYKIRPENSEGKTFEGQGDSAFAASEGKKGSATIGTDKAKTDAAAPAAAPVAAANPAAVAATTPGATLIQLGAYSDAATAEQSWTALTKRFGFLSGVNRKIAEGAADGGRKVYRLQAVSADAAQAQQLCAKLKAAGENCLIVK
jgi:cell division protein FtsN